MSEPESPIRDQVRELEAREQRVRDLPPRLRAVAPIPSPAEPGESRREAPMPAPPELGEPRRVAPTPAPRTTGREPAPGNLPVVVQRAMGALRAALPLVQKVLPILDGQILTTISNLLAPHSAAPPPIDLSSLEGGLADLRLRHIELFSKVSEQNAALKRVAENLEKVQESANRNALEQQELKKNLKAVGRKANVVAIAALALLAVSLATNVFLFLHFERVVR